MAIIQSGGLIARRWEAAQQARIRARLERHVHGEILREIERVNAAAAAAFEAGEGADLDAVFDEHRDRMERILAAAYGRTMESFGARLFADAEAMFDPVAIEHAKKAFRRRVDKWIRTSGDRQAGRISFGTKHRILGVIRRGEREGADIAEIAGRLRERVGYVFDDPRTGVIARSEVHTASQAAVVEALETLPFTPSRLLWVAMMDHRTRFTHRKADGQVRHRGEPFDVGGAKLNYPGDPFGPPREVIKCRCIAVVVPDR